MKILANTFIILIFLSFLCNDRLFSQVRKLYDTEAVPTEQFQEALKQAQNEGKHVMLQIGGNWCPWCFRFHDFYEENNELDSIMNANYVLINVNYNPKNKDDLFSELGFPQRFGFPVIVITDAKGNRLHTQNSWYLEDGKNSYDYEKFKSFIKNWTPEAIDPKNY